MKKQKKNNIKRRAGRQFSEINYDTITELAAMQCTEAEMAAAIGFSSVGFSKRKKKDDKLVQAIELGREEGKTSLRRLQFDTARKGEAGPKCRMQIHLGKIILGQIDRQEITANVTQIEKHYVDLPGEDVT